MLLARNLLLFLLLGIFQPSVGQQLLQQFPVPAKSTSLTAVSASGKAYTCIHDKGSNLMLVHGDSMRVNRVVSFPADEIPAHRWTLVGGTASDELVEWVYARSKDAHGYGGNQIAVLRYEVQLDSFHKPELRDIPFDHCNLLAMQQGTCWIRTKSRTKHQLVALHQGRVSTIDIKNTPIDTIFRSAVMPAGVSFQPNLPLLPLAAIGTERTAIIDSGGLAIVSIPRARRPTTLSATIISPSGLIQNRSLDLPTLFGPTLDEPSKCALAFNAPYLAITGISRTGFQCVMLDVSSGRILVDQTFALSTPHNDESRFSGFWMMNGTDRNAEPTPISDTVKTLRKLRKGEPGISIARYANGTLLTFGSTHEAVDAAGAAAGIGSAILAGLAFGVAPVMVPTQLQQVYGQVFVPIGTYTTFTPAWTSSWRPVYLPATHTTHTTNGNQWFYLGPILVRRTLVTPQKQKPQLVWLAY